MPLHDKNSASDSTSYTATDEFKKQKEEDRRLYDLTSLSECLTVAMHEYDLERNKKQSFDNRAGIIITIFAAIGITLHDKIPITELIEQMSQPLTFLILLDIIMGCLVYVSLISSLIFAVSIVAVKGTNNFNISIINGDFISSAKIDSVSKLVETYLNLVRNHRKKNGLIAKRLAYSQWAMIFSIVLILVYLTAK